MFKQEISRRSDFHHRTSLLIIQAIPKTILGKVFRLQLHIELWFSENCNLELGLLIKIQSPNGVYSHRNDLWLSPLKILILNFCQIFGHVPYVLWVMDDSFFSYSIAICICIEPLSRYGYITCVYSIACFIITYIDVNMGVSLMIRHKTKHTLFFQTKHTLFGKNLHSLKEHCLWCNRIQFFLNSNNSCILRFAQNP